MNSTNLKSEIKNQKLSGSPPLLKIENLKKHFPLRRGLLSRISGYVYAVDDVSFEIHEGETVGLVGESGCGKTTVGRTILKLLEPTDGSIVFKGKTITDFTRAEMRPLRREMQIIFQDPYASLNPRMSIESIIGEPLYVHGIARGRELKEKTAELMREVGINPDHMNRYPHEFSGGQRQRIGIARAIALKPSLIIGDEPVSALDVSIQAQVINLLMDLQEEYNLSYMIISHDLRVVEHICDRVMVMYLGRLVESAGTDEIYSSPRHPYTEALLSSVPLPDPSISRKRIILEGDVPSPANPPSGCYFHPRCPDRIKECAQSYPELKEREGGRLVACHLR